LKRYLSENLNLTGLQLAGINKTLSLGDVGSLDGSTVLASNGKLLSESSELVNIDLAHDELNVVKDGVDLGSGSLAVSEVVDLLDGALKNTLVLLGSVLSGLLVLLVLLTLSLGSLLGVLLGLLLSSLLGLLLLLQADSLVLLGLALGVLSGTGLLAELLDTLILGEGLVNKLTQTGDILVLALAAGVGVLLLGVALLVTALSIIGNILIKVLECTPAVEVVPEVVEILDLLLGAVLVTELGNGLLNGETTLSLEARAPGLVKLALGGSLLLGRGLNIGGLIDGVELATTSGVKQQLSGDLNALEEAVVLVAVARRGLLVGVVTQNLLAVSTLDLLGGCPPAVAGQTENGVVVLGLLGCQFGHSQIFDEKILTFQSLASRLSIMGSSSSEISPSDSSSVFLTFCWAWRRSSSEKVRL